MTGYGFADGSETVHINDHKGGIVIRYVNKKTKEKSDLGSCELVDGRVITKLTMSLQILISLNMLLVMRLRDEPATVDDAFRRQRLVTLELSSERQRATITFSRPQLDSDLDEHGAFKKATIWFDQKDTEIAAEITIMKESARMLTEYFAGQRFQDIVMGALDLRLGPQTP